ncbi:PPOX class F420-dependent oxidoreductase [Ilumatobacter sp.]|uniref:PPOX class F420-dependent oxidoreductase n=1 Tax=Ilumatobacter sp. TaxID=1967498 RepID=UPI003C34F02F
MAGIADEKYVALTTYKKDGTTKTLPVWIADFGGGQVGFTTASSSFKVKRIVNDSRVILQPSDMKGVVTDGSEPVTGTAQVVTGAAFEPYRDAVKKKYGIQYGAMNVLGKFMSLIGKGSGTDAAVVITLD